MKTTSAKINALLCGCALLAFAACDSRPTDADDNEPATDLNAGEDGIDSTYRGLPKGQGGTNGDSDFCNNGAAPCVSVGPGNEGDCDSNAQCTGGGAPRCGKDNGLKFGTFENFDFCWQAHCENGVSDGDETGIDSGGSCGAVACPGMSGDSTFCTSSCQCGASEGDCDTDADCTAGNICGVNNGASFGMPANFDVCWPLSCENNIQDGNETGVDCGGADCQIPCEDPPPPTGPVQITEIQNNPTGTDEAEWIEINNPNATAVSIAGWTLSDFISTGESNVRWTFPAGTTIPGNGVIVVTRYNDSYSALFGMNANFEMAIGARNTPGVPNLTSTGGTTQIILADVATGDAVILRNAGGTVISGVEYGTQDRSVPGTPAPRPSEGSSLHRVANTGSSNTSFAITTAEGPGVYPN